jgi:hypothetical protein
MPPKVYRKAANAYLADRQGGLLAGPPAPDPDGSAAPTAFRRSDAWLLLAIKYAQGEKASASLERIIGAGDFINHTIFLDAELEGGFARLEGAGFIAVDGAGCAVTGKFDAAWSAAGADRRRAMHKQLESVRKILGVSA